MINKTYLVDENLPTDLLLLCERVLSGDTSAADPMVDCYLENRTGGETITPAYVNALEDTLREFRRLFIHIDPAYELVTIDAGELINLSIRYHQTERMGRTLNRQGLQ
jgi:hypothetical protein